MRELNKYELYVLKLLGIRYNGELDTFDCGENKYTFLKLDRLQPYLGNRFFLSEGDKMARIYIFENNSIQVADGYLGLQLDNINYKIRSCQKSDKPLRFGFQYYYGTDSNNSFQIILESQEEQESKSFLQARVGRRGYWGEPYYLSVLCTDASIIPCKQNTTGVTDLNDLHLSLENFLIAFNDALERMANTYFLNSQPEIINQLQPLYSSFYNEAFSRYFKTNLTSGDSDTSLGEAHILRPNDKA